MKKKLKAIVIGVSAGGIKTLNIVLKELPKNFQTPIIIVMHRHAESDSALEKHFDELLKPKVLQAGDKDRIKDGMIYFAPPNYHLMIEENSTFALSTDNPVHFARPSIDVLFETAADLCGEHLIGIILTGANADGAQGLQTIKKRGGVTIVQNPDSAEFPDMPRAAIKALQPDLVLTSEEIGKYLRNLFANENQQEITHE